MSEAKRKAASLRADVQRTLEMFEQATGLKVRRSSVPAGDRRRLLRAVRRLAARTEFAGERQAAEHIARRLEGGFR